MEKALEAIYGLWTGVFEKLILWQTSLKYYKKQG